MKWLLSIMLPALIFILAACGVSDEPDETVETPAAIEPTAAPVETLPPPVITTDDDDQDGQPTDEDIDQGGQDQDAGDPRGPVMPWPADRFGYGTQSHAVVGDPAFAMDVIRNQLDLDWVKVQLKWSHVHPEPEVDQWFIYDGAIDEANKKGLNLLLSVVSAPAWTRTSGGENGPPDDFGQFTQFIDELLDRYPGKIQAIEVWNEQNLDREWATSEGLKPERYVEFLAQAYKTIKAKDPNILVISGALAPTGIHDEVTSYDDFLYLDSALAAGLLNYADCVGVHHNGYNIGPDVGFEEAAAQPEAATAFYRGPFDNPHHSWSFKTTVDTYAEKVKEIDPAKKLCVTEFGWASNEGYDALQEGFEWAADNTLEEQAQFITQAFQQMHDSGNVWLAFLFNYDFGNKSGGPEDNKVHYSIVDTNGAPRPAFGAVGEMLKTP